MVFSSPSKTVGVTPPCCLPTALDIVPDPPAHPPLSFICLFAQALQPVHLAGCSQSLRSKQGLRELIRETGFTQDSSQFGYR